GVAIAVRNIDLALWRQRRMGAAVERLAAHKDGRLSGDTDFEQHLAFGGAFAHAMGAVVGHVEAVVGTYVNAVRAGPQPLAPGRQKIAVAIKHHHRVFAAVEGVDPILAVDADSGDFLEGPAVGELSPVVDDAVSEVASADDVRHSGSSLLC